MNLKEVDWCPKIEIYWLLGEGRHVCRKTTTIYFGNIGDQGSIGCEVQLWKEESYARFYYSYDYFGETKYYDYKVNIIKTPGYFGGNRKWFECPLSKDGVFCGRRIGILYMHNNLLGCRKCHGLVYSSNNLSGLRKSFGRIISSNELEALKNRIKRKIYRRRLTKQSVEFLKFYDRYIKAFEGEYNLLLNKVNKNKKKEDKLLNISN